MKKLNIAFLLISDGWAGTENAVYNLVKCLSNSAKVSLFLNKELIKYYSDLQNVSIYNLGHLGSIKGISRFFIYRYFRKKLYGFLKDSNYDLINLYLESSYIVYSGLYDKIKMPVIATLRGLEIKKFFDRWKSSSYFLDVLFLKKALKKSTLINSVSKWQIKNLPDNYKKKTIVIPNGIDTENFRPLKIKKRKDVILFVGRFIELKGIKELINVAKGLQEYEFWFVGQGTLSNIINLPNTKNLGIKNKKELIKLYNQSTIVVQPSYHEGFSNVCMEATSCGKAVIVTPLGFSEYIENGKNGIIIPCKDETALRDAIIKLMKNEKLRKKLEKNARKKAESYTWEKIAKKHLKTFEGTIK